MNFIKKHRTAEFGDSMFLRFYYEMLFPILLQSAEFMLFKKLSCLGCNDTAKGNKGNKVRDCHKAVEYIRHCPYKRYREIRADQNGKYIDISVCFDYTLSVTDKVLQTSLGIIIPSENSRECKERKTEHKQKRTYAV